jgi:hypothetical protein
VYAPDWLDDARLAYTNRLATLLAALVPADVSYGSVSTVPGAFRARAATPAAEAAIADRLLQHVVHLMDTEASTGRSIRTALEPEPWCVLETVADAIAFFERHLYTAAAAERLAALSGRAVAASAAAIRRHLGVCFDACHMAVEFEDYAASLAQLDRAGIRIPKFQISSALRITDPSPGSPGRIALEKFAEDTYLHQVVSRSKGRLTRFVDLPDALAGGPGGSEDPPLQEEWRIHFHVPVFLRTMGALDTTQPDLEAVLDLIAARPAPACLEVETYTWDVLPAEYRTAEMSEAIARELAWTRDRIEAR